MVIPDGLVRPRLWSIIYVHAILWLGFGNIDNQPVETEYFRARLRRRCAYCSRVPRRLPVMERRSNVTTQ